MKPNLKDMRLFIWDFDGTLMDTYPVTFAAHLRLALADLGHELSHEEVMVQLMDNLPNAIRYYAEKFDLPELPALYKFYEAQGPIAPPPVFPQVKEVLARIRGLGGVNCIFTHRRASIYPMLELGGLRQEFAEIITPDDVPPFAVKPAPDTVLYLMEKYGGAPETTVMVGDRECDLGSGRNAGCHTLHLLTPAVPEYPACDWRIENYGQMLDMLK